MGLPLSREVPAYVNCNKYIVRLRNRKISANMVRRVDAVKEILGYVKDV